MPFFQITGAHLRIVDWEDQDVVCPFSLRSDVSAGRSWANQQDSLVTAEHNQIRLDFR